MTKIAFTSGTPQQEPNGTWYYVVEWLSRNGVWVAYGMDTKYVSLRSDIATLDRLGYHRDRRRVRHWFQETVGS